MRANGRMMLFAAIAATLFAAAPLASAQLPSGERELGRSVVEPGYDMRNGSLIYVLTPAGSQSAQHANAHAVSPLYIIVYPSSAANAVGTMNCAHQGGDNCPDHGPGIADLAQSTVPAVYGDGVWGHDHIMDGPGGEDFNVGRQVVVVLFTNPSAANIHVTTEAQLEAALDAGDAFTIDTSIVLHAGLVSAATYAHATPRPPLGN